MAQEMIKQREDALNIAHKKMISKGKNPDDYKFKWCGICAKYLR